jgi:cell division protein FtsB
VEAVAVTARRTARTKAKVAAGGSNRARARWILLGATVLSAAVLVAWFPAGALLHQRSNLSSAAAQLRQLHQQDTALAQEGKNLNSSSEISRIARGQYQLVSPGQRAFEVLPPSGTANSDSPYAQDPGDQSPVAPSASVELPPGGAGTTTTTLGRPAEKEHRAAGSSTLSRMLHALEFWR